MTRVVGFSAAWGGQPIVARGFTWARTTGLEPDAAQLIFSERQFRRFVVEFDPERFGPSEDTPASELVDDLNAAVPKTLPTAGELPYVKDLHFSFQLDGDAGPRRHKAVHMYLGEVVPLEQGLPKATGDAVATAEPLAQERLIAVGLVDIRRWWENYGEITQRINIRKQDGTLAADSRVPGSRESNPQPWALREIMQFLLNRMPGGSPSAGIVGIGLNSIVTFPDQARLAKVEKRLDLWGAKPKTILKNLLDEFGLTFALNLDGTISIYTHGAGTVGEVSEGIGGNNDREADDIWLPFIRENNIAIRSAPDRPRDVVYIGGPKVWSMSADYCTPALYREIADAATGTTTLQVIDATPETLTAIFQGRNPFLPNVPAPDEVIEEAVDARMFFRLPLDERLWTQKIRTAATALITEDRKSQQFSAQERVAEAIKAAQDPESVESLSEELIPLAVRQLFRVYRISPEFFRFLPLLDRAERYTSAQAITSEDGARFSPQVDAAGTGSRKPIQVEAFSFDALEVELTDEALGVKDLRTPDERELQVLREEATRIDLLLERLKRPDTATSDFLKSFWLRDLKALGNRDLEKVKRFQRLPNVVLSRVQLEATDDTSPLVTGFGRMLRSTVSSVLGVAISDTATLITQLEKQRDELLKKITELQIKVNPRAAVLQEIRILGRRIRVLEGPSGKFQTDLRAQQEVLFRKLRALDEKPAKTAEDSKPNLVRLHVNRARKPVAFRVIDANEGLFEITEGLPGWLADPYAQDPAETEFYPMPVRVTFGTFNGSPVGFEGTQGPREDRVRVVTASGADLSNTWMRIMVDFVQSEDDLFQQYFRDTGHTLPPPPELDRDGFRRGLTQTKFGYNFTSIQRDEETAEFAKFPWVILDKDPDFRELIELDGTTNRAQLLDKATRITREIMLGEAAGTKTGLDKIALAGQVAHQVGDQFFPSGTLVIEGARPVNCNGLISGVSIDLDGDGLPTTTVSLDAQLEPFPNVVKPGRLQNFDSEFGLAASTRNAL